MSNVLSSRIVASHSPNATEVAHNEDDVVALMADVASDESIVAVIIDDDNSQGIRVAVAKAIRAKPVAATATISESTPTTRGQLDTAAPPRTLYATAENASAPTNEQPRTRDEAANRQSKTEERSQCSARTVKPSIPNVPGLVGCDKDNFRNASESTKPEAKVPGQPEEIAAESVGRSVEPQPAAVEVKTPSQPAAPARPVDQPRGKIEVPEPTADVKPSKATTSLASPTLESDSIREDVSIIVTKEPVTKVPNTQRKKRKKSESIGPAIVHSAINVSAVELSDPEPAPTLTYGEWFRENILQSKWMTSFCAFYAHWLLLIVLALLVVHGPNTRGDFTITASRITPLEYEPVDVIDTRIVEPEQEVSEVNSRTSPTVPIDMSVSNPTLPDAFIAEETASGSVNELNKSEATESQVASLSPSGAVNRGSFSVWTVPEFPDPGESYKVVIQAKVPDGVTRYPVTDLQGFVVGSDGYRKLIPGSLRGFLPIRGGYVQFEVPIVAASEEIKDTVWIQSTMLKEQQKLLIEF